MKLSLVHAAICASLGCGGEATTGGSVSFEFAGQFTTTGVTGRARLADLNLDGRLDVILFKPDIYATLNLGGGQFGPVLFSDDNVVSYPAYGFAVGDLDGDGLPDAVAGHIMGPGSANLSIVFGNGDGTFTPGPLLNNGGGSVPATAIGDLNGDGLGDIRSTPNSTRLAQPNGEFGATIFSGNGGHVGDPLLADVNADGLLDLIQVVDSGDVDFGHSELFVNHGQGNGAFTFAQEIDLFLRVGQSPLTPRYELARLNDDALPDLVIYGFKGNHSGPGGLRLLKNLGGTFAVVYEETQAEIGDTTLQAPSGDFNGDGIDDVLILRKPPGVSEIRISDGDFNFSGIVPIDAPFEFAWEAKAALVADLVGSPLPDILFIKDPIGSEEFYLVFENVSDVALLPGDLDGNGTLNEWDQALFCAALGSSIGELEYLATADFNGDHTIDHVDQQWFNALVPPCDGDPVDSATFAPPPDGTTDAADLAYQLGEWGNDPSCADYVSSRTFAPPPDGKVDAADLAFLLGAWGPCE